MLGRVTYDPLSSQHPALIWTGENHAVVWHDYRDDNSEIYFARLDPSGEKINSEARLTNDSLASIHPSLVWSNDKYKVAWHDHRDSNSEIYFCSIKCSEVSQPLPE